LEEVTPTVSLLLRDVLMFVQTPSTL